jgi:glycosyltransferase involved in cell wall biosynthesis
MRILYLTQYFPPEMGAPQARIPELMRQMVRLGHRVTILTAMPNYPHGRVFRGYRGRLVARETFEGMRVVRTWIYPTISLGFLKRTASALSFAISSGMPGAMLVGAQDVILVESPPLFLALTAVFLKWVLRCPYVAVVADLWPEVAIETGMLTDPRAIRVGRWLEKVLYERARAVVTQTPGQVEDIRARFPAVRVAAVSGGVDNSMFFPENRSEVVRREFGVAGRIGVLFSGLHGFAQGLDTVLDAAELLRERDDIRFVLIGNGAVKQHLVKRAEDMKLPNVVFHEPVPRERMPAIAASMDIALAPLRRGVPRATIPTKIYEAMASGIPVVVAGDGEAYELVSDGRIGLAVPAEAGRDLAQAIARLSDDPGMRTEFGANAVRLARSRYDRGAIAVGLDQLLRDLVKETHGHDARPRQ